jgi:lysozyme family protein
MMDAFHNAVQFVLDEEGSGSNLRDDFGGMTKWGISSRIYPKVVETSFSRDDAISIYQRDYWLRCRCDQMPPGMALLILNCAVNQGPETAIKILQRSLRLKDDGVVGAITLGALKQAAAVSVINEFAAQQLIHYFGDKQFNEFGLGWTRRTVRAHRASLLLLPPLY